MNRDELIGRWKQLAGATTERWGAFVRDPAVEAAGRHARLAGGIRARLASSRALATRQLDDFLHRYRNWDLP